MVLKGFITEISEKTTSQLTGGLEQTCVGADQLSSSDIGRNIIPAELYRLPHGKEDAIIEMDKLVLRSRPHEKPFLNDGMSQLQLTASDLGIAANLALSDETNHEYQIDTDTELFLHALTYMTNRGPLYVGYRNPSNGNRDEIVQILFSPHSGIALEFAQHDDADSLLGEVWQKPEISDLDKMRPFQYYMGVTGYLKKTLKANLSKIGLSEEPELSYRQVIDVLFMGVGIKKRIAALHNILNERIPEVNEYLLAQNDQSGSHYPFTIPLPRFDTDEYYGVKNISERTGIGKKRLETLFDGLPKTSDDMMAGQDIARRLLNRNKYAALRGLDFRGSNNEIAAAIPNYK